MAGIKGLNVNWKGDEVGYISLHQWIRTNKPIPERCEDCGKIGKLDAHNKDGLYTRDLDQWEFICRRCHMAKDGRLIKLVSYDRCKPKADLCRFCKIRNRVKKSCGHKRCQQLLKNERRRNASRS